MRSRVASSFARGKHGLVELRAVRAGTRDRDFPPALLGQPSLATPSARVASHAAGIFASIGASLVGNFNASLSSAQGNAGKPRVNAPGKGLPRCCHNSSCPRLAFWDPPSGQHTIGPIQTMQRMVGSQESTPRFHPGTCQREDGSFKIEQSGARSICTDSLLCVAARAPDINCALRGSDGKLMVLAALAERGQCRGASSHTTWKPAGSQ